MIAAAPGETFPAFAEDFPTGLTGTLTVSIRGPGSTVQTGPLTAGIYEDPPGTGNYGIEGLVAPTGAGTYRVYWRDPASGIDAVEELRVQGLAPGPSPVPPPIGFYCSAQDAIDYAVDSGYVLPANTGPSPTPLVRMIQRAMADIDSLLGNYEIYTSGDYAGLKLDVRNLDFAQTQALRRATCAQILYRIEMGEQFFVRPQQEVSGPEFSTKGRLARVSPAAKQELAGTGLIRATTSIAHSQRSPGWLPFAYSIDDDVGSDYGGLNRGAMSN